MRVWGYELRYRISDHSRLHAGHYPNSVFIGLLERICYSSRFEYKLTYKRSRKRISSRSARVRRRRIGIRSEV